MYARDSGGHVFAADVPRSSLVSSHQLPSDGLTRFPTEFAFVGELPMVRVDYDGVLNRVTTNGANGLANNILYTTFSSSVLATGLVSAQFVPPVGNYINYFKPSTDGLDFPFVSPDWAGAVLGSLHGEARNTIVIEGHSSGVLLTDHSTATPRQIPVAELVQTIRNNPNYNPNAAIVLNACHTGTLFADGVQNLAQTLSQLLPNKIIAPDGSTEYNPVTNSNEITTQRGAVSYNKFNAFQSGALVGQEEWTYGQSGLGDTGS